MSENQKQNDSIKDLIINIIKEQNPETTNQLIGIIQKLTYLPKQEIIDLLNKLEAEDKIHFHMKKDMTLASFTNYLFSIKSAWYWAIVAISILTVNAVFTIPQDLYPLSYLRNVLGVIFVLFLPGYAFVKAFFQTKVPIETSSKNLDNIERFVLSIGLSLAITPMIGLILYYTPIGIGLTPITLTLLAFTIVLATAAVAREYQTKSTNKSQIY